MCVARLAPSSLEPAPHPPRIPGSVLSDYTTAPSPFLTDLRHPHRHHHRVHVAASSAATRARTTSRAGPACSFPSRSSSSSSTRSPADARRRARPSTWPRCSNI
jgi:hypothetical protein